MTDVRSARTNGADDRPTTESTLAPYRAGLAEVAAFPGATPQDWRVSEDGDGNLNLVFADSYRAARPSRWISPQPDDIAWEFRADGLLKAAAPAMKLTFLCHAEALVHGDLHSGSIMATADDVRVIDPGCAFFGPMGFDVGALIGNLILACLSQSGHEDEKGGRDGYRAWILRQIIDVRTLFSARFVEPWSTEARATPSPPSWSPTRPAGRRWPRSRPAPCAPCSRTRWALPAAR
jgi:5-methylthioribose kinase